MADSRIVTDSEIDDGVQPTRSSSMLVSAAVLTLIGAIGALLAFSGGDPPPGLESSSSFDPDEAGVAAEAWWRNVISGNTEAAVDIGHPDADFDFEGVAASFPLGESTVAVAIDVVSFGSPEQPQLCYILLAADAQYTGSFVFRRSGDSWLLWEVRPDSQNCHVPTSPPG